MDWSARFASRAQGMRRSEVRELLKLLERPGIISFAGGVPEPALFPVEAAMQAAIGDVLERPAPRPDAHCNIATSEGWTPLRERICALMRAKGVRCDVENVLITNGAQQAIELAGRLFIERGAPVMIQWPTYLGALQAFSGYGPKYVQIDALASDLSGAAPAMGYVMSDFQNPTGESLTLQQRAALAAVAEKLGAPLVEDDPYGEIYFEAEPLPPLIAVALDGRHVDAGTVLYCGTFSKTLAPGLRVGWIVGPKPVIDKMVLLKQATDIQVSTINQVVISELLDRLAAERLSHMRSVYRIRRDAMLAALQRTPPAGARWTRPTGGLFVWLELASHVDATALLPAAIERGVAFVPGEAFHPDRSGRNTLRLSYSLADPDEIDTGIERLSELMNNAAHVGEGSFVADG